MTRTRLLTTRLLATGLLATSLLAPLWACAPAEPSDPREALCGRAIGEYLGLPNPVSVRTEAESSPDMRMVRYQSFNAENIPVEGTATCIFAPGNEVAGSLTGVTVDGKPLGASELAKLNRSAAR